jgi:hypothetical protein
MAAAERLAEQRRQPFAIAEFIGADVIQSRIGLVAIGSV